MGPALHRCGQPRGSPGAAMHSAKLFCVPTPQEPVWRYCTFAWRGAPDPNSCNACFQECHSLDILTIAQPDGTIEVVTVLYWGDCRLAAFCHPPLARMYGDLPNQGAHRVWTAATVQRRTPRVQGTSSMWRGNVSPPIAPGNHLSTLRTKYHVWQDLGPN